MTTHCRINHVTFRPRDESVDDEDDCGKRGSGGGSRNGSAKDTCKKEVKEDIEEWGCRSDDE